MKNNFSSHQAGKNSSGGGRGDAQHHQVNRITSNNFNRSSLNSNNSFVHKHNIGDKGQNQWTHNNGKWNQGNHDGKGNGNHKHNGNNWNHNGNWSHNGNWNNNGNWNHNHNNYWWGGGWGWGGGWPWWAFTGLGSPYYGYNNYLYGYGNGFGYGNGYGYGAYNNGYATTYAAASPVDTAVAAVDGGSDGQFADQGEVDFKAGNYKAAVRDWQHALVDDPQNGAIMMLLAQTLLALGQYDEAAGATQAAMQMLPEDKWGVVVSNYSQLYGNPQDYTDQLKAVEKARDANPESPALRFLLGFHFGYLNYPKNAVTELDKGLTVAPKDLGAYKLRQVFAAKWPEAPAPPAAAVQAAAEAAKEAESQQPPAGKGPPGAPPAPGPSKGVETGSPT
jgi:tetratricopeptide (TPR) repeat protein